MQGFYNRPAAWQFAPNQVHYPIQYPPNPPSAHAGPSRHQPEHAFQRVPFAFSALEGFGAFEQGAQEPWGTVDNSAVPRGGPFAGVATQFHAPEAVHAAPIPGPSSVHAPAPRPALLSSLSRTLNIARPRAPWPTEDDDERAKAVWEPGPVPGPSSTGAAVVSRSDHVIAVPEPPVRGLVLGWTAAPEPRGFDFPMPPFRFPPPAPAPTPVLPADSSRRCIRVPLPRGGWNTQHCVDVTVNGVPGLRCADAQNPRNVAVCAYVADNVDGADTNWDERCPGEVVYVHRGCNLRLMFARPSRKQPSVGYTLGHLVTKMVAAMYKHFHEGEFKNRNSNKVKLSALVGTDAFAGDDVQVSYEMMYIVAVRSWQDRQGRLHYFPELEIRI